MVMVIDVVEMMRILMTGIVRDDNYDCVIRVSFVGSTSLSGECASPRGASSCL